MSGVDRLLGGGGQAAELLVPLALLATTCFLVNTGLLAVVIASTRRRILPRKPSAARAKPLPRRLAA